MSSNVRTARIARTARTTRTALAASVAALTLLAVSGCGPDNDQADGPGNAAGPNATAAPIKLPSADELKNWKFDDWDKWAQQNVITPAVQGFWDLQKIMQAQPAKPLAPAAPSVQPSRTAQPSATASKAGRPSTAAPSAAPQPVSDDGGEDPRPSPITPKAVPHPYSKYQVNGKIFFEDGDKSYVCSGTVVSDPAHPGKSNLVWTASHCLHSGKGGKFHTNITFAPAFNSSGAASNGKSTTQTLAEPFGEWGVVDAVTSPQWPGEADAERGGAWSQYDFGIMRVANPSAGGKSLEETVGGSVPVWFNAPRDQLSAVSNYGYPAAPPFDGAELNHCDGGRPVRTSSDATRPSMLTIGCRMTAGDSGGAWYAAKDGRNYLVSDTSIGGEDNTWEAGPYLDDVAAHAFDYFTKKK
ncbi:serine protease [Kitasatospora sp. NBC_00315]|uniref:trypsin-like serine peptidase n=1 Tax=Kitasatospora sp. NBC_00315 TaxID=2975963 RepID=UPI0032487B71